jgi:hypothetical protein
MFQGAPASGTGPTPESFTYGGGGKLDPRDMDFVKSQTALSEYSNRVLKTFTQTRERIYEIQTAIADAVPGVNKLGGEIKDVSEIISQVAIESRRNVITTAEEVEKLFTIQKVLGLGADVLSKSFLDVGMSIESIPDALKDSMNYVQSIGGNAKTVIGDVQKNMEQMNRYQFEGGVQGLTKMAARASMLRFEMKETFALAEKVLDPEGAIEVAGAFQRLGVAAGNLVDPFQLMNMSINDPSGLQDSLADIAKQFTEFDAETKTFKINPQGVLTLREMEKAAGLSAGSLSKMGLAASELDKRLSAVDAAGLTIASEEDKQYLANIAKLDSKTGTYKVTLEDGTQQELADLTQPQFDRLIEFQKNQPATLEETAKASLRLDEIMNYNVAAIKSAIVGGTLTAPTMQDMNESIRNITQKLYEKVGEEFTTKGMRDNVQGVFENAREDIKNIISSGNFTPEAIFGELMKGSGANIASLGVEAYEKIKEISVDMSKELLAEFENFGRGFKPSSPTTTTTSATGISKTSDTTSYGNISVLGQTGVNPNFSQGSVPGSPQKPIEVDGDIKVDVQFQNLPTNLTSEQMAEVIKAFNMAINEQSFKNYIINLNRRENSFGPNQMATF